MSPTIFRTRNVSVRIYPKDHAPPHVHVYAPGAEAKFQLEPLECLYSRGFSKKALGQITSFLRDRRETLQEAWNDYQE